MASPEAAMSDRTAVASASALAVCPLTGRERMTTGLELTGQGVQPVTDRPCLRGGRINAEGRQVDRQGDDRGNLFLPRHGR